MSTILKVLVPEATTNYIKNPSFRYDTTDWNAVGSSCSRVLDHALYGIASMKIVTNGAALREGAYYRVGALIGVSEPITVSIYARGRGTVQLRLIEGLGKEWVSDEATLHSNRWTRLEVTGYSTGGNDLRLYIETANSVGLKAITFYVDGAQMERKAYATTFCDGDQEGCRWNVIDSNSHSTRDAYTRAGGRWVELAGSCKEDKNIYMTVLGGLGMAPISNNTQSWALSPGSFYQNTKIHDRQVTISFFVKHVDMKTTHDADLRNLHELRQQLIDLFKPDKTGGGEAFWFSYQAGEREMLIRMRYEAGLEGEWDKRNQWVNGFPIRFLAVDPYLVENNYHAQALLFKDTAIISKIAGRIDGKWNYMASGVRNSVTSMAVGKRGEIYFCGGFTLDRAGTIALNYVAYWDGENLKAMGTGLNGSAVHIAVAPNGDVYVVGEFTTAGGVAANRIARWNGTAWSAVGSGFNDSAWHVEIAPNGDVYVGGKFTTAGGIAAYGLARWDGTKWNTMGNGRGVDGEVYTIAISKDGSLVYIGGTFTKNYGAGTTDLLKVAQYNPTTNFLTQVGNGFDDHVNELRLSPAGILYAGGQFDASGSEAIAYIAKWTGSKWSQLGEGITGSNVLSLTISEKEEVIAVGQFTKADDIPVLGIAFWNGTNWTNLDVEIPQDDGTTYLTALYSKGDLYVGGSCPYFDPNADLSLFSSINYITNYGTAEVKPVIYIYGPGELKWIENQTTKKRVYLNLGILDNEEVFIDFGKGQLYSNIRGDLLYGIIPGSDFDGFSLVPGENKIAVFMTDDVASLMYIYHQPRHWSVDATVDAEELS